MCTNSVTSQLCSRAWWLFTFFIQSVLTRHIVIKLHAIKVFLLCHSNFSSNQPPQQYILLLGFYSVASNHVANTESTNRKNWLLCYCTFQHYSQFRHKNHWALVTLIDGHSAPDHIRIEYKWLKHRHCLSQQWLTLTIHNLISYPGHYHACPWKTSWNTKKRINYIWAIPCYCQPYNEKV